jgi:hypothetical protein
VQTGTRTSSQKLRESRFFYYWTVSRYIHLNPVHAGLVARPQASESSSYPGLADPARRRPWVAHEELLTAWRGEHGGTDPIVAYRKFTGAGLSEPPPPPYDGCDPYADFTGPEHSAFYLGTTQFAKDGSISMAFLRSASARVLSPRAA